MIKSRTTKYRLEMYAKLQRLIIEYCVDVEQYYFDTTIDKKLEVLLSRYTDNKSELTRIFSKPLADYNKKTELLNNKIKAHKNTIKRQNTEIEELLEIKRKYILLLKNTKID